MRRVRSGGVWVPAADQRIRYVGSWGAYDVAARATVNSGSRVVFGFTGRTLTGRFDVSTISHPGQIWISVDGARPTMRTVNADRIRLAPRRLHDGPHTVEITVKDVDIDGRRWKTPLHSGIIVTGFELDRGARIVDGPPASDVRMLFLGDSITQGSRALNLARGPHGADGRMSFAALTARAFGADADQIGFGGQGVLRPVAPGGVPPADETFGWNFHGSPAERDPHVIVVNQGTNDSAFPAEAFRTAYSAYLGQIRAAHPNAWIFAMRPFGGYHATEVEAIVKALNDAKTTYVDTTDWLEPTDFEDGVHPLVVGHLRAARRLTEIIASTTGLAATRVR
ncbi:SGNH/GDSL hydrolase family protein [Kribbella sp. NBC_01245]|uniref:SGNH/GDSL hydrolase family protein n=1 Tax=Kribbella sp. NBC_01245 TaxID=2903578 RepID=UPI002E2C11E1|nr:SGNH/GDSL hydrolase family protein [Kribbella sp. NBC_01245]